MLAVLGSVAAAPAAAAAPVALPFVRFVGAAGGDGAATSVAVAGDVNGDGHADVVIGAPGPREESDPRGGAAYVVFGPFAPGEQIDLAALGARGFAMHAARKGGVWLAGMSVAGAGDVNGDGLMDVIVGAPAIPHPEQVWPRGARGHAYVVFGRRRPVDVQLGSLGSRGITLTGTVRGFPDAFGWQVAGAGDVDGDGLADVAIDAPGNPGFESSWTPGIGYVVFGRRAPGRIRMSRLGRRGFRLVGASELGGINAIVGAGDWNRDGRDDVAMAGGNALGGEGAIYVVYGRRYDRDVAVAGLGRDGLLIRGGHSDRKYRLVGAALAGGSDMTGDGRPDLVVGMPAGAGRAWLVPGSRAARPIDLTPPGTNAWVTALGADRAWRTASAVAVGRVDADRRADTVLLADGTPYVVYGTPRPRTARLASLTRSRGFAIDRSLEPRFEGDARRPPSNGFTAVAAGDVTGDGRAEILAGAPLASHLGRDRAGAAYLFFAR